MRRQSISIWVLSRSKVSADKGSFHASSKAATFDTPSPMWRKFDDKVGASQDFPRLCRKKTTQQCAVY